MQNFSINYNDKTYWISRSVAVSGFIFGKCKFNNDWYVLANKRGTGCMDYLGYWNCPCGYLDYNENLNQAMIRELYEETGIQLNESDIYPVYINSDPNENRQNVTVRYIGIVDDIMSYELSTEHSEENEIADIRWIPVNVIDAYNWAFNHNLIIREIFNNYINITWYKKFILKLYRKYFINILL